MAEAAPGPAMCPVCGNRLPATDRGGGKALRCSFCGARCVVVKPTQCPVCGRALRVGGRKPGTPAKCPGCGAYSVPNGEHTRSVRPSRSHAGEAQGSRFPAVIGATGVFLIGAIVLVAGSHSGSSGVTGMGSGGALLVGLGVAVVAVLCLVVWRAIVVMRED